MRIMITVKATEHVEELQNGSGIVVVIKDIPRELYADPDPQPLADFIAKEAGHARKRFEGKFKPDVDVSMTP